MIYILKILLILFSFLRKLAWDYGRIALISRNESRELLPYESRYNVWTSLFYGNRDNTDGWTSEISIDQSLQNQDKGFCSWIVAFFKITDEHILQKSGRDAIQYLKFQRYLIIFTTIITAFCIGVVLPINFKGTLERDRQSFGFSTMSNLDVSSPLLWVHATGAIAYLCIAILLMRHFTSKLRHEDIDGHVTRTVMIMNIPSQHCFKTTIMEHFQQAYPDTRVEDVQFAYNITQLVALDKKKQRAFEGLNNSQIILQKTGERPTMLPFVCGHCCKCCTCCGCKHVDAIDYYSSKLEKYRDEVDSEKVHAFRDPLGIAFVTFEEENAALSVRNDFKRSCRGHVPSPSTNSFELNVANWEVEHAPAPDNIYWENLSISPAIWWSKAFFINALLFILLFFLTTPSIVLNLLNEGNYYKSALDKLHSHLLAQFIPTLILWLASALLPSLVYNSDQLIGHWTRSAEHHAVMRKTFLFLVLMVLILPSLGLTSAKALFDYFASKDEKTITFKWECIFIPDNGAFFVNYVITSAFIGTAAEIIRFPELFIYTMKLLFAKSAAERTSVRKSVVWEFQFGVQYAWMLCVFTVVVSYSLLCPLITPFGLVYMIFKHAVDRYNIYFAYGPSKIDKHVHSSAINFVIIAVSFAQAILVFFIIVRSGGVQKSSNVQILSLFATVALFLTITLFLGRVCLGWFKVISPMAYKRTDSPRRSPTPEETSKPFIPNILLHEDDVEQNVGTSYGSTNPVIPIVNSESNQEQQQ
ncbi:DgyrCDS1808 [Dimorphilus gyrociliatus]|uniref:DgyrCDS1808 n=1 Tax=Dimorphilus gyrociliatus TaxID=2664684 RepID=A0A7I8VBK9_9ANNE|nr:DgyrCDS1808 [Dimorphilus gyrociliatus]